MEDKIEVGEYVETIYGEIFKVFHIPKNNKEYIWVVDRDCDDNCLEINEIVKHSKNIIDLIQVRGLC